MINISGAPVFTPSTKGTHKSTGVNQKPSATAGKNQAQANGIEKYRDLIKEYAAQDAENGTFQSCMKKGSPFRVAHDAYMAEKAPDRKAAAAALKQAERVAKHHSNNYDLLDLLRAALEGFKLDGFISGKGFSGFVTNAQGEWIMYTDGKGYTKPVMTKAEINNGKEFIALYNDMYKDALSKLEKGISLSPEEGAAPTINYKV